MKHIMKITSIVVVLFLFAFMCSCEDDWNKHYDRNEALPGENLYELIKSDATLSKFTELIDIAGYDSLLTASQTFTVWAPDNDALKDVDITDIEQVKIIVANHIARFNYSTAEPDTKVIRMINGKVYYYSHQDGITFGGSKLVSKDQLAKNGLLHTIDNSIVYARNIYEYIAAQNNTTKIAQFISTYFEELKEEVGYDTIKTSYNPLLEDILYGLGNITAEDSLFTMIIPTDDAWDAAYERISPYFKVYNADSELADSIKRVQASLAIINDLIYRTEIATPALYDSLISTSGSVIHDVNDLFMGTTQINASNGLIYLADEIRYDNVETWNKIIPVECEEQEGRTTGSYTSIYTRTVDVNSLITDVSGGRYIYVQPTNTSAQPSVTFNIPDVLSGKYNIYADFIPAIIDGESFANDSTKLSFRVTFLNASGREENKDFTSDDFVTSGSQKRRIKVAGEYEFPVSNYYDRLWLIDTENRLQDVTTRFRITTNVTARQVNDNIFTRRFRVDRIIFEPIRN